MNRRDNPRTRELGAIISRINRLREQLFRGELNAVQREEIVQLVAFWRLRLALMLSVRD